LQGVPASGAFQHGRRLGRGLLCVLSVSKGKEGTGLDPSSKRKASEENLRALIRKETVDLRSRERIFDEILHWMRKTLSSRIRIRGLGAPKGELTWHLSCPQGTLYSCAKAKKKGKDKLLGDGRKVIRGPSRVKVIANLLWVGVTQEREEG